MTGLSRYFYSQCPLKGVLRVTGADASDYLQGQFSNQLKQEGEHPVVYGFWLSIKGKVEADSYILKQGEDDYLLVSFGCDEAVLLDKVGQNIIADDVVLEAVTKQYQVWITWGDFLEPLLEEQSLALPEPGQCVSFCGGWVLKSKLLRSNNLVWLLPTEQEVSFDKGGAPVPFDVARIGECVPLVPQDIGPGELPQEGALEESGISVKKGCYLGQVIMMRIHSMGDVKRALYSVKLAGEVPPLPVALYAGARSVGTLRSVATVGGVTQGLALLKKSAVKPGAFFSLSPEGESCVEVLNPVKPI